MVLIIVIILAYFIFGTKTGKRILAKLFESSLKVIITIAVALLGIFLVYSVIKWMLSHIFQSIIILVIAFACMMIYSNVQEKKEKQFHAEMLNKWQNQPVKNFELSEFLSVLETFIKQFNDSDTNKTKFLSQFPFGRISYFLSFFQSNLDDEEPLYFSPVRSKDSNELREYGIVITTNGIYISNQLDKTDKEGNFVAKNTAIKFSGIIYSKLSGDMLTIYYENYENKVELEQKYTTVPLKIINSLCETIVSSGISKALHENSVYDYEDIINEKENKFNVDNIVHGYEEAFTAAGTASAMPQMNNVFAEVGNTMNKRQGHGDAAEYANTAVDRFTGDFRAQHMGANNAKDGADRSTHRLFQEEVLIQSKYENDPVATIKKTFLDHDYDKDIKIEVARDKYNECRKNLQERIDKGELEHKGIKKGDKAENYLRRGYFSVAEAHNIAVAGRIEGIAVDAMQGIVCSAGAGSLTAILTFATCKWQGMDTKEAALQSLKTGARVIGKSTAIFVITMQLSRKNMVSSIWGAFSKNGGSPDTITNPIYKISENLATKISKSSLAKTGIGKKIGLDKTTGKSLISGTVAVAVTFGPDILRSLAGRISFKQLVKNSAIGGAGFAGAAIGQTVIPIPVVGSMIGGAVASFIAKKTLDNFIEDDAIEMFAILKEEFIDIVPMSGLNSTEFNSVVEMTIAHPKLQSMLRDMFAFGDSREYARENIVNVAVCHVLSQRNIITDDMYYEGIEQLAAETA